MIIKKNQHQISIRRQTVAFCLSFEPSCLKEGAFGERAHGGHLSDTLNGWPAGSFSCGGEHALSPRTKVLWGPLHLAEVQSCASLKSLIALLIETDFVLRETQARCCHILLESLFTETTLALAAIQWKHIHTHIHTPRHTHRGTHTGTHAQHGHTHRCTHRHTQAHMHRYTSVHTQAQAHTGTHTGACTHTEAHTHRHTEFDWGVGKE